METGNARYGSDQAGLLCGYLFTPGQPGRPIEADDASDIIAAQAAGEADTFLWLHFNLANQASQRWLLHRLSLPEAFHTSLDHAASTRLEVAGSSLVAVINDVTLFGLDASSVATMALCVDARLLVSARHTPLRSAERLRASVVAGECFRSAVDLLGHLLRDQVDVLAQIIRDASVQVDRIEDTLMASRVGSSRPRLGGLRRVLVRLQRLLAPEPASLFRLLNRPPDWIGADDMRDLRQSAEEFSTCLADSAALIERVRLLQEELSALVNEQTNHTLFVLTVVTVLALPMTIIPGLLGMNVGGLPLQHPAGFWIVIAVVLGLVGIGAIFAFLRRAAS